MIYALGLAVFLLSWILPWWGFCAVSFLFGHKMKSAFHGFSIAFFAVFFLWLVMAYTQNIRSHGYMAEKMGSLFGIENPYLFILANAAAGGLLAGIWCLSGYQLHQLRKGDAP